MLRLKRGGQEEEFAIFGGFLQVRPDRVVVLAETADMAAEIDLERAERARHEAERALEGAMEPADLAVATGRSAAGLDPNSTGRARSAAAAGTA